MNTQSTRIFTVTFVSTLAFGFAINGCADSSDNSSEPKTQQEAGALDQTTHARKACIDPATGELISPPSEAECPGTAGEPPRLVDNGKTEELVEEPQPDGSSKVDLKDRFKQHEQKVTPGGRLAVIDPTTGQLLQGRAAQERAKTVMRTGDFESSLRALATAGVDVSDLKEERLEVGGAKVDLQGRFRSFIYGAYDNDGSLIVTHEVERVLDGSGHESVGK